MPAIAKLDFIAAILVIIFKIVIIVIFGTHRKILVFFVIFRVIIAIFVSVVLGVDCLWCYVTKQFVSVLLNPKINV